MKLFLVTVLGRFIQFATNPKRVMSSCCRMDSCILLLTPLCERCPPPVEHECAYRGFIFSPFCLSQPAIYTAVRSALRRLRPVESAGLPVFWAVLRFYQGTPDILRLLLILPRLPQETPPYTEISIPQFSACVHVKLSQLHVHMFVHVDMLTFYM